jgi:hypothetical protein
MRMHDVRPECPDFTTDSREPTWELMRTRQHRGTAKKNHPTFNACLGEAGDLALGEPRGSTVWRKRHDMQNAQGHF